MELNPVLNKVYCFSFSLVYGAEPCIESTNATETTTCGEDVKDDQFGNIGYALIKVIFILKLKLKENI